MESAHAGVVRRLYADPTSAGAFEVYAPDIEWDMTRYIGWMDDDVYRGHAGVREFMRGWIASFERWEPTVEDILESGDEVVAVVRDRAWLRGGASPMVRRFAHAFLFREGRIVRSRIYSDPDEALAEVGLSPPAT
jgi:ketosteroid isomerase-like protein